MAGFGVSLFFNRLKLLVYLALIQKPYIMIYQVFMQYIERLFIFKEGSVFNDLDLYWNEFERFLQLSRRAS